MWLWDIFEFIIRLSFLRYIFASIYLNLEMYIYIRTNSPKSICFYFVVILGGILLIVTLPLLLVSWIDDYIISIFYKCCMNQNNKAVNNGLHIHGKGSKAINLMSYNIQVGRGMDGKVNVPRISETIKSYNPPINILGLQEVEWDNPDCCQSGDQVQEISTLCQFTSFRKIFVRRNALGLGGGIFGAGICCNYPILDEKQYCYPRWWFRNQRNLIALKLQINESPSKYIWIINTHLQNDPCFDQSYYQLKHAMKFCQQIINFEKNNYNNRNTFCGLIFCGDLNLPSWTSAISYLKSEMTLCVNGSTFPSNKPKVQYDYIWLHQNNLNQIQFQNESYIVNETMASDHRPVFVRFYV
eukprot:546639_1